jgi:hypothetical protein
MTWVTDGVHACDATLVPLTLEESLDLLATMTIGRLVFTERALPVIQPVYVAVERPHVLLRSITGAGLGSLVDGSVVALEAGRTEPPLCRGWSVTVTGRVFAAHSAPTHSRRYRVHGCSSPSEGELMRLETGLVSGHRLCHPMVRGSPPSCDNGTSQMTSTPPEGRPRTMQLPPS